MTALERVLTAWVDSLVVEEVDGQTMRYVRLPTPAEEAARAWALHQAIEVVQAVERLLRDREDVNSPIAYVGPGEVAVLKRLLERTPPA